MDYSLHLSNILADRFAISLRKYIYLADYMDISKDYASVLLFNQLFENCAFFDQGYIYCT